MHEVSARQRVNVFPGLSLHDALVEGAQAHDAHLLIRGRHGERMCSGPTPSAHRKAPLELLEQKFYRVTCGSGGPLRIAYVEAQGAIEADGSARRYRNVEHVEAQGAVVICMAYTINSKLSMKKRLLYKCLKCVLSVACVYAPLSMWARYSYKGGGHV